jgi:glycosyltransferase involved in cell wall biosynthesis
MSRVGIFPYSPGYNPYQRLFAEALEGAGVEVVRIRPRKLFPIHWALSHRLDLLHLDWPHDLYQGRTPFLQTIKRMMYGLGLRRLANHPFVWTAHNLSGHDAPDLEDETRMIQRLVDCCDGIITLSESARTQLQTTYRLPVRTRVAVIYHGHYIDAYPNTISTSEARLHLGIPSESRVVLSLGRIAPYKGLGKLIEAFRVVAGRGDVLVIAGPAHDPAFVAALQHQVDQPTGNGRIILLPQRVPDEDLQVFFNASDVVALPFQRVLNSGSLLLAMSFGRAVVAPRMGSIPEIAMPDAYFGHDTSDTGGLARALHEALSTSNLLERGSRSKRWASVKYGWADVGHRVRALYEDILSG